MCQHMRNNVYRAIDDSTVARVIKGKSNVRQLIQVYRHRRDNVKTDLEKNRARATGLWMDESQYETGRRR